MPLLRSLRQGFDAAQSRLIRLAEPRHDDLALNQSRYWARAVTWALCGTSLFGIAWLTFAQTEEIVVAPGKLEPIDQVKDIQVPAGGVVARILVKEGQSVRAGQVLVQLDSEAVASQNSNIAESLRAKRLQFELKNSELERSLQINTTKQRQLSQQLVLQRDILNRFDRLVREGASAQLQYLSQRNQVQELEGQLEALKLDRLRETDVLRQQRQQIQSEIAQMQTEQTAASVNRRYQQLRSPVDGMVFGLKPTSPGFVAQASEPVMKIVPRDRLQAKVEIPSRDIGFVHNGQAAELSIDSFPASDFGVLQGRITRIGSDALPPDQLKADYRFPAVVSLNSQVLRLKNGVVLPLQVGMSLTANIKMRKVSYLQLMLGEFRNKADSLRRS